MSELVNELVEALPHLTDEELEQLEMAVGVRIQHMQAIVETAQAPKIKQDAQRALVINNSLRTAIAETRMSIASRQQFLEQALQDLTRAEPGEDGRCIHCKHEVKSVPGGHGPVFIHTDTQVIFCTGQQ